MAWIDQLSRVKLSDGRELIGASFRGVPFFVEDSDFGIGRRTSTHQFIDGDIPVVEDLGKLAGVFRVTGYVLGDDYITQRNALISAFSDVQGPGELVHPFYGKQRVQCGSGSIRESKSYGGMAVFSLEFKHAPVATSPTVVVNLPAEVVTKTDNLALSNSANLDANLVTSGQPSFALASIVVDLSVVSEAMKEKLSGVATTTQSLASMSQAIDIIVAQASSIIRTPSEMISALVSAIRQMTASISNAKIDVVDALMSTFVVASPAAAIGETPARIQERINQTLFADAIRTVVIVEAARILPYVAFNSIEDAVSTRDKVVEALDGLAESASSDTFPDIVNLRSAVLRAIPGDALLARIQTVEQFTDLPSLILSYRLYGDVDSAEDIVSRNRIRHPAFSSGTLKVLSDV